MSTGKQVAAPPFARRQIMGFYNRCENPVLVGNRDGLLGVSDFFLGGMKKCCTFAASFKIEIL